MGDGGEMGAYLGSVHTNLGLNDTDISEFEFAVQISVGKGF